MSARRPASPEITDASNCANVQCATNDTIRAEATNPASHRENEAMARRRFQQPTPFKEGNFWWLRVWDTSKTGSRKRQRIKLANADMAVREVQKIVDERLRPMNQGLGLTGSAMSLSDFMEDCYIPRYLRSAAPGRAAELSSSTRECYRGVISKYLQPDLGKRCLRDLTRPKLQEYFSYKAAEVSYPTMSKIRDALSSVLRSAVDVEYLNKNPMEGLRLPKDRRPRRPKPTITPEQFANLVQLLSEPYATMIFTAVWTGLRVSELIGLKWRCIHADSITIEERYCRGDWSQPKTGASAATIGVDPEVIARLLRLPTLTVEVRAGCAIRKHKLVKSGGADDLVFQSVQKGAPMNDQNILKRHLQPAANKLGLPFVNWRCLRTSHATWLVQAGADPKSVQGQMRHSRISTTMDIYAQIVPKSQRRALEQLSAFAGVNGIPVAQQTARDLDLDFSGSEPFPELRSKTVQ
ncbi:MAG: phage integrase [Acidobacteriaceae bacterium]|nr:phage integrase [Acidobacteriaceae bacterium]